MNHRELLQELAVLLGAKTPEEQAIIDAAVQWRLARNHVPFREALTAAVDAYRGDRVVGNGHTALRYS